MFKGGHTLPKTNGWKLQNDGNSKIRISPLSRGAQLPHGQSTWHSLSPKGRLTQGLYKPMYGNCATYFHPDFFPFLPFIAAPVTPCITIGSGPTDRSNSRKSSIEGFANFPVPDELRKALEEMATWMFGDGNLRRWTG